MPLLQPSKTKFRRQNKNGVTRIVRDRYSNDKGGWFDHSRSVKKLDKRCLDCGKTEKETPEGHLHVHHIKPLSRGGKTTKRNLVTLCEKCHTKRHGHLHTERKRKK